ncbi:MAG: flagellar basal body rod protein FlgC [Candidatus Eisenbacteria sp.]|nr:flagellar basal body rod protein FlgC [Candidatus Eisenbacteria bacterium]
MDVSASALAAYRQRMNTIAENLANAQTTRTPEGGPYQRKAVVFESVPATPSSPAPAGQVPGGITPVRTHTAHLESPAQSQASVSDRGAAVRARVVVDSETPFIEIFDPGHPDADADGVVRYPNVNPVTEMVNLVLASRAYEANVAALRAEKRMQELALSIGRA